jgi:excisionase family DNA binding protein
VKSARNDAKRNKSAPEKPKLRTLPKAAKELGIGLSTLRRLLEDGKLRSVRIYSREMVSVDELDRFLRENEGGPHEQGSNR